MGAELAGALLGFAVVGVWIDRHYGSHPWGLLVCAISGLIGGLYNFLRSSIKTLEASNRRSSESGDSEEEEGRK